MEEISRQVEKVSPMFSNVFNYEDDVVFEQVNKGQINLKFVHKKLYQGSHILKCHILPIGLHRISDLGDYAALLASHEI
jgi:hypothetical protein